MSEWQETDFGKIPVDWENEETGLKSNTKTIGRMISKAKTELKTNWLSNNPNKTRLDFYKYYDN